MKAQTIRHAIEVRLFSVVLLATCAFAPAVIPQTMAANFNLPFEVHWGRNVLPAGEYTISMDSLANVGLVRSANGNTVCFTPVPTKAHSQKGATTLLVMVRGNEHFVRPLNLPSRGVSLIYAPATSAEREMLAKADQVQTVQVITAGK
jgi:hypothetical protein